MWILFGVAAILFAILNVAWTFQKKNAGIFRFLSLAFTALTVCAFYADGAMRVEVEDWSGLMDIMPTMSKALWFCTVCSIIINSISLLKEKN